MRSDGFVVAVDGPSGAGKSTASRGLARRLGFRYVDTGAMYRSVAYLAARQGIEAGDRERIGMLSRSLDIAFSEAEDGSPRVFAGGQDVTDEIRSPAVSELASAVSTDPSVREHLVRLQRVIAGQHNVVMEGRDIGTVVFPDAPVKFFLTARASVRAKRRSLEFEARGLPADVARVEAEQAHRDARDTSRAEAPLREAADAIVIDTTDMSLPEVIDMMERIVTQRRQA